MYKAPVEEIAFTLKHVAGMGEAMSQGLLGDLGEDLVDAILAEAGRFATEEVAPLADIGDRQERGQPDLGMPEQQLHHPDTTVPRCSDDLRADHVRHLPGLCPNGDKCSG